MLCLCCVPAVPVEYKMYGSYSFSRSHTEIRTPDGQKESEAEQLWPGARKLQKFENLKKIRYSESHHLSPLIIPFWNTYCIASYNKQQQQRLPKQAAPLHDHSRRLLGSHLTSHSQYVSLHSSQIFGRKAKL